ncbi:hypothetical protein IMF27_21875 [Pseudomonas sp. PCH199]|uniref:hypothetical protein n=1 Tax=unclassified Pseudomonas TaxID=196821 RepID=UPI000FFCB69A|nr:MULTISPECIES: hypothetical protein [unclassified Pseudomonas]MCW8277897.1 hypothetical protein [Pseudomonas sp. PCH199]
MSFKIFEPSVAERPPSTGKAACETILGLKGPCRLPVAAQLLSQVNSLGQQVDASAYNVVKCGALDLWRTIGRSIFHYATHWMGGTKTSYDGKVYRDADGANLALSPPGVIALSVGLTLKLPDGQHFELIETGRTVSGITYSPTDDPDIYRSLIDIAQVAQECGEKPSVDQLTSLSVS